MNTEEEQARLARLLDLVSGDADASMDPNDLAQLAAGTPGDATRQALEAQLVAAPSQDRRVVAAVATAAPATTAARLPRRLGWRLPVASAAALVLVALGLVWLLDRPKGDAGPWDDAGLSRAFAQLREQAPEAFDGVTPVLAKERAKAAPVRRGGIRVLAPAQALLVPPESIRWQAVPGATAYAVQVLSDEGEAILDRTHDTASLPWPAETLVQRGSSYVVTIATVVAGVRARGSAAFRVLSTDEVARYEAASRAIDGSQPASLRPILHAHLAIRRGLIAQALRHVADTPDTADTRALLSETRAYLARLYGDA